MEPERYQSSNKAGSGSTDTERAVLIIVVQGRFNCGCLTGKIITDTDYFWDKGRCALVPVHRCVCVSVGASVCVS